MVQTCTTTIREGGFLPVSLRLNKELEDKVNQIAKKLNINKTEVVKRSLKNFAMPNLFRLLTVFIVNLRRPGTRTWLLSIDHCKEVLKKKKKGQAKA